MRSNTGKVVYSEGLSAPTPYSFIMTVFNAETTAGLGGSVPLGSWICSSEQSLLWGVNVHLALPLSRGQLQAWLHPCLLVRRIVFLLVFLEGPRFLNTSSGIHALPTLRTVGGLCGGGSYWFAS